MGNPVIALLAILIVMALLIIARSWLKAMLHLYVPFSVTRPLDRQKESLRVLSAMRVLYVIDVLIAICFLLLSIALEWIFNLERESLDRTALQANMLERAIGITLAIDIACMALLVVLIHDRMAALK